MRQALLINIWQLSAILLLTSSPLKLFQVGWGRRTFSGFSRNIWLGSSPGCGWATHGHSQSCLYATLAVCLGSLSCWKVNLLSSLRFWMLWTGFSYFGALSFSSTLTSPSVTVVEKQPITWGCYQHTLLLGWYSAGDEQSWFPSNMMLRIEVHQTRESRFLQSEGPLGVFFCKFQVCFHVSTLRRGLSLAKPP